MSDSVVVKTRKFMKNPLLSRRQVRFNNNMYSCAIVGDVCWGGVYADIFTFFFNSIH
mgnify:CR=1 FL=1